MWLEYFEQYLDRVFPRFLSEKLWNYKDDLCMVGAEDLYCATGSESWREPVRRNASFLMDDAGRGGKLGARRTQHRQGEFLASP